MVAQQLIVPDFDTYPTTHALEGACGAQCFRNNGSGQAQLAAEIGQACAHLETPDGAGRGISQSL